MLTDDLLMRYLRHVDCYVSKRNQEAMLDCLEADSQALMLDCGCHAGVNARKRADAKGIPNVVGIELNAAMTREAAQRGLWVMQADLNHPIPLTDNSLDVVMASDVLEHLVETRSFVREIYRVLRPGGYAVVSTPNLASWHNILALLLGFQPFSGPHLSHFSEADLDVSRRMRKETCQTLADQGWGESEGDSTMYRHIVVGAYRSLRRLFIAQGFSIERMVGVGYYPLPPTLERVMTKLDPVHSSHLVLKARKSSG
jgi:SAM-dependent methyltransferase